MADTLRARYVLALLAWVAWAALAPASGREVPESFSGIVSGLLPAVVNIATTRSIGGEIAANRSRPDGDPFQDQSSLPPGHPRGVTSLGSGFLISPDGYIVTNSHAVEFASRIRVILNDERVVDAAVVGIDGPTDLAVVKISVPNDLPYVKWGDSRSVRIGDWVVAIGNPFGLGGSVTAGIVSGRSRDIRTGPYDDYLQTDAAINSGNSGGPLFDIGGRVIGVNTVILSPTGGNIGIGFAIPSEMAGPVVEQLRARGEVARGWLGVKLQTVTGDLARALGLPRPRGALVAQVVPGGPAEHAGIKVGDVILGMGGEEIRQVRAVPRLVAVQPSGRIMETVVWRSGRYVTLMPTLRTVGDEAKLDGLVDEPELAGLAGLIGGLIDDEPTPRKTDAEPLGGMKLMPLDGDMRRSLSLGPSRRGVYVAAVKPGSAAEAAGVHPGDVIVDAARAPVSSPQDVVEQLSRARRLGEDAVLIHVYREGEPRFMAVVV